MRCCQEGPSGAALPAGSRTGAPGAADEREAGGRLTLTSQGWERQEGREPAEGLGSGSGGADSFSIFPYKDFVPF